MCYLKKGIEKKILIAKIGCKLGTTRNSQGIWLGKPPKNGFLKPEKANNFGPKCPNMAISGKVTDEYETKHSQETDFWFDFFFRFLGFLC